MYNPFKKENEGRPVRGRPPRPPMAKAAVQEQEEELPSEDEVPMEDEEQETDEQVVERSIPSKKTQPTVPIKKEVIDEGTYEIRQVAIQTAPVAYNLKTGEQKELFELVVDISNRLARLEKDIRG